MIRISTTTLETYRRLIQTEYQTEEELVAQIKGKPWEPSWQANVGKAFHKVLELPEATISFPSHDQSWHEWGGYKFLPSAVAEAQAVIGPGLREVKATRTWHLWGNDVTVVGQADHLEGLGLSDVKCKFSSPDSKDYDSSLQWRFYLMIFGGLSFRYVFCHFKEPTDDGFCQLKDVTSVKYFPYAELEADCVHWLSEFLVFCFTRQLLPFLDREGSSITL